MFGSRQYPEGRFHPERGGGNNWHIWCHAGALEVLRRREYVQWLLEHPGESYTINFANGSAARIQPGHELWQELLEITKTHMVEVFPLTWEGKYVSWTGEVSSYHFFDAIAISAKKTN